MRTDEILTLPEVARLLKVAEKTAYTLAQRHDIPAFKVGGQWRFSRAAIDRWIEARTNSERNTKSVSVVPRRRRSSRARQKTLRRGR